MLSRRRSRSGARCAALFTRPATWPTRPTDARLLGNSIKERACTPCGATCCAHEGAIRRRRLEQQTEQAWCLTLVTNAVATWTTEYYGLAVTEMRAQGRQVENEILAHIAHSEKVNFFGSIAVDIEHELAKLDPSGYRPLRERNSTAASILV